MPDKGRNGEEDTGFRVTDRRRVGPEGLRNASQAGQAPGPGESPPPGEPAGGEPAADPYAVPVADLVRVFIGELHARAWLPMGLIMNPATNQVAKDLAQARLAIDCIASLVEHLAPAAAEAERGELQRLLTDLRRNYVRQSSA
jgi:hypothetical protein